MKRVLIVQPWLPQYRISFFERLLCEADTRSFQLSICHGDPPHALAERGDAAATSWALHVPSRTLAGITTLQIPKPMLDVDLVIVEQALRNAHAYRVLRPGRSHRKTAYWGHGRAYTSAQGPLATAVKKRLTLRTDWFFAYTAGGAEYVMANGYPGDRITVVNNSIDTVALTHNLRHASPADLDAARPASLPENRRYAIYVGAIDGDKRIDRLLESSAMVASRSPDFNLVVVGQGEQSKLIVNAAMTYPWLHYVGAVFGRQKDLLLGGAELLLMPGRVGLVAVDSFASGTPIVTTAWPWHAPEFEYLRHGENAWVTADDAAAFAEGVLNVWTDPELRSRLREGCFYAAAPLGVEQMARRFSEGIEAALEAKPR